MVRVLDGPDAALRIEFAADYDPIESVRFQRLGPRDPTLALTRDSAWRTSNTPEGPATVRVRWNGRRIVADAWGEGARWALERTPRMCGSDDRDRGFVGREPWLREMQRRHESIRLGCGLRAAEVLPAVILQQRVRFAQAAESWRLLLWKRGEVAPGPRRMCLPLRDRAWRDLTVAEFGAFGIDAKRARTLRECALHMPKIDRVDQHGALDDARTLLPKLRGVGPWTSQLLLGVAFGDPDAVPVGDYHLPGYVAYAFQRRTRATDDEMLTLLEPYRPHRYRVIRLLMAAGVKKPRRGPRFTGTPM